MKFSKNGALKDLIVPVHSQRETSRIYQRLSSNTSINYEKNVHPQSRNETPTATNTAQDGMLRDPYLPTKESELTGYFFGTWFAYWIDEECKTHLDRCHWTNTWGMFNLLGKFVAELGGFNPKPKGGGE